MNKDSVGLSANAFLIQTLLPLSKSLGDLSKELLSALKEEQALNKTRGTNLFEKINSRNSADVQLAV
jgi:hexosaminidase